VAEKQVRVIPETSLSVVVPVFNGAARLPELCERLSAALEITPRVFELILVNDGSADESWNVICKLSRRLEWVRGIDLMRNYGQHNALLCGIHAAVHEVIITMDDDLQHPPEEIPKLLSKLAGGYDVVYGTPEHKTHGPWRNVASHVTKLVLQNAMGAQTARKISAFRAFRTPVRNAFANYSGPYVSIDVLLTWGTTRFVSVDLRHDRRRAGSSNYTFGKLVAHTLTMATGFSSSLLRLASLVGFAFTGFGIVILIYVLGRYLIQGTTVPGFPFLASIIAILSGAQMFALGIIGEYLARMHFRMMERPTYTVRSTTAGDDASYGQ
jgi:undecaprenyl-phosphate 4-deoxy-4-formamido-L-arabinose transferase